MTRIEELAEKTGVGYSRRNGRLFLSVNTPSFSLVDLGEEFLRTLLEEEFEQLVVVVRNKYYFYYTRSDVEKALGLLVAGKNG